jgi:hypothetical protein
MKPRLSHTHRCPACKLIWPHNDDACQRPLLYECPDCFIARDDAKTASYQRPCEICGKISTSHADDYECSLCTADHNQCCHDDSHDCCVDCAKKHYYAATTIEGK